MKKEKTYAKSEDSDTSGGRNKGPGGKGNDC